MGQKVHHGLLTAIENDIFYGLSLKHCFYLIASFYTQIHDQFIKNCWIKTKLKSIRPNCKTRRKLVSI